MCLVFFNDTATTEIYTLSLHDALPIWRDEREAGGAVRAGPERDVRARTSGHGATALGGCSLGVPGRDTRPATGARSEEHTSELQSRQYLVCRLLLEKKKIE